MSVWAFIVPIGFVAIVAAVFNAIHTMERDPNYIAHRRQQKALRDYHIAKEREKRRVARWWKARGKVIRPGREEA